MGTLTKKRDFNIYDRAIPLEQYLENNANRLDDIFHDKNKREVNIIEVVITNDFGILKTTYRKICKYSDFNNAIKRE